MREKREGDRTRSEFLIGGGDRRGHKESESNFGEGGRRGHKESESNFEIPQRTSSFIQQQPTLIRLQ